MFGYCGIDCSNCEAYIATQQNDDAKREQVAEKWRKQYDAPGITVESINCDGCNSNGRLFHYCANICEIRKCSQSKELTSCAHCDSYICGKLDAFLNMVPEAAQNLENLRKK